MAAAALGVRPAWYLRPGLDGVGTFVSSHLPYLPVFPLLTKADSLRHKEGEREDRRALPSSPASLS